MGSTLDAAWERPPSPGAGLGPPSSLVRQRKDSEGGSTGTDRGKQGSETTKSQSALRSGAPARALSGHDSQPAEND